MEITVVPQPNKKLVATLYLDGQQMVQSKPWDRPGCAVREVMNALSVTYGIPSTELKVSVEGW
jgi:hypothetical protein